MSINPLDKKTVKFLTTTQVITSVVTAVKELVENSIDAGAKNVDVKLRDNGATLIEVSDDGIGISSCDANFMALQSYTSKIKNFDDLDNLHSYGFRGEALSSLCQVADVTITTKTKDDLTARRYILDRDGTAKQGLFCHDRLGTTVKVTSLFKDLAVRKQIIAAHKKTNQEVKDLLRSFSLCQPNIRFNFFVNDKNLYSKPCTETLRETLSSIFGNKILSQVDFIEKNFDGISIKLIIPKKEATEFNEIGKMDQLVIVNRRPVSYKKIEKAVNKRLIDFFNEKIGSRKKLAFIVNLEISPHEIDVNLEPNKTRVFLTNEEYVIKIITEELENFYRTEINEGESEMNDLPTLKKRKVDVESSNNSEIQNKENYSSNVNTNATKKHEIIETISQLPIVDLGEDFQEEEISKLPSAELKSTTERCKIENPSATKENNSCKISLEDWSRGRTFNNIPGGTNVEIYENLENSEMEKKLICSTSIACRGFVIFSRAVRNLILQNNPGMSFVDLAKALASRWRELSSGERNFYRERGQAESKALMKKSSTVSSETAEKNKEKLIKMFGNMKKNEQKKKNCNKDKYLVRTVRDFPIRMERVKEAFHNDVAGKKIERNILIGPVDKNLWIAKTGVQIWICNIDKLFEGLSIEDSSKIERTRESLDKLFQKWLVEGNGMSWLHPITDIA